MAGITVPEWKHIKAGETVSTGYSGIYITAPKTEGYYTLYELANEKIVMLDGSGKKSKDES